MTITFKHLVSEPETTEGFPVVVMVSNKGKRKKKIIFRAKIGWFDAANENLTTKHPDFDILAPRLMDLKLKARKIQAQGIEDVNKAMQLLFVAGVSVYVVDFCNQYVAQLEKEAANFEKLKDVEKRNRALGNAKVYTNVVNQFKKLYPAATFTEFDYEFLLNFRRYCQAQGNSNSTVHMYLRTMRSLYNKAQKIHGFTNTMPFENVFANLKPRATASKKKYLDVTGIKKLMNAWHDEKAGTQYRDLFLLQFYFGGCDTVDVYYLKKEQLYNGRVFFERGKTGVGVNLAIHPLAQKIIDTWITTDKNEYVFPWRKDQPGYKTFHRKMYAVLTKLQKREDIRVLPAGGKLGAKVARHTFATMAKNLFIEDDLLRELMGHERNEVDNYYKDKYPEPVRDAALFKIIDSVLSSV